MTAARKLDPAHGDPVLAAFLSAPLSDERETADERAAFEEGMADIREGRVVSHSAVLESVERMRLDAGE